ncbi:DMT family transporter [Vallitalea guaymasensis]|uniref:DMT family transporter n=1 Tax=Vallitalea guaymasensis TaxID=1185412 RepID=A0A8J8MDY3_9FIRM|nr:DMT family transporter [Vallitalea guaymasensis]QUH30915.1 DMT family transporter [Vallitalea guaymasensis]
MFEFVAIFNGVLIALMISFNGLLSQQIGNNESLIIIHLAGLIGTSIIFLISRNKIKSIKGIPKYLFLGGAIGIFNVTMNNVCFDKLGAALTISLGLMGQLIASMCIDHFGLLGVKKNKINIRKLTGIAIMSIGIIVMIVL